MICTLICGTDEGNSGRGVHSFKQRHSLAAALHSYNDFAASFDNLNDLNFFPPLRQ